MSEPLTTWRPLIDFDGDERRGALPEAARGEPIAADWGLSALAREFAANDLPLVADSRTEPPFIRGDFAAIEAALLRTVGEAVTSDTPEPAFMPPWAIETLRATRVDADAPRSGFAQVSLEAPAGDQPPLLSALRDAAFATDAGTPPDSFILFDDAAVSGSAAIADEDKRSRRPLYIMAALVLAGLAGITATSLRRDGEPSQEASKPVTTAAAENSAAPATPAETPSVASVTPEPAAAPAPATAPQQAAAVETPQNAELPQTAMSAPQALASQVPVPPALTAQISSAAQASPAQAYAAQAYAATAPDTAAMAPEITGSLPPAAEAANASTSILAPPSPGKAQTLAEPSVKAAMTGAKKVKVAAVHPDGSLVKAEAPAKKAAAKVAHLKARPVQAATRAATPATHTQSANAEPTANQPVAQAAAPVNPQPAAVEKPNPGPLAFVNTAVSSITGATGKLFAWARPAN